MRRGAGSRPPFLKKEKNMASELYSNLEEAAKAIKGNSPECKGLIFRGYSSTFVTYRTRGEINGAGRREGIRLLKKKSCPGCGKCGWMLDVLLDHIDCETLIFPDIEHGVLYGLRVTNEPRDYESGYVDDYDLEFYKIKEK